MQAILRLPLELSQEIFLACLPDKSYPTLTSHEAPLLLTQVSRGWRDLALNTPKLWASLHVAVPTGWQQTDETVSYILKCFKRAQSTPMEVSLWSIPHSVVYPPSDHPVTTCIRSESWHVRALELNVSADILAHFYAPAEPTTPVIPGDEVDTVVSRSETPWPLLEKVVLNFGMDDMDSPPARGEEAWRATFWSAPALKSVNLTSVDVNLMELPLPWRQMENIEVMASGPYGPNGVDEPECSSFTPGEAKKILKKCPRLSNLSIAITTDRAESEDAAPPDPFTHHHLKDLHLTDEVVNPARRPMSFLQGLRLPALERLTYFLMNPTLFTLNHINHPLVLLLTAHNAPSRIKKLEIGMEGISYRGLVECLKFMPVLGVLRLFNGAFSPPVSNVSCNDAFLEMFLPQVIRSAAVQAGPAAGPAWNLPAAGLCPLLNDIIIDEGSGLTSQGILHFARSRVTLNQTNNGQYSRPRRFCVQMIHQTRPDYAARDDRGGTNEAEEGLWALGVDAKVKMEKPRIPRTGLTARRTEKQSGVAGYNPSAGLPREVSGEEGKWYYASSLDD